MTLDEDWIGFSETELRRMKLNHLSGGCCCCYVEIKYVVVYLLYDKIDKTIDVVSIVEKRTKKEKKNKLFWIYTSLFPVEF